MTLLTELLAYWDGDSAFDTVGAVEMQQAGAGYVSSFARPDSSTGTFEVPSESDVFFSKDVLFDDHSAQTVNAWFYLTNWQGMILLSDVADSGDGACTGLGMRYCPDSWFFELMSYNGTNWDGVSPGFGDAPPGYFQWFMLTLTSDDSEARVYINGVLAGTLPKTAPTATYLGSGPESFYLNGPHPWGAMTGNACYLGVWGRVLDETEIAMLYNDGFGRAFAGL